MIDHICRRTSRARHETYMLCSLAGNLRVTQTVDGNKGCQCWPRNVSEAGLAACVAHSTTPPMPRKPCFWREPQSLLTYFHEFAATGGPMKLA